MATLASLVRAFRSNPRKAIGAVFAALLFVWERYSDYQTGSGLMESIIGPHWASVVAAWVNYFVESSLFSILALVLTSFLLWRISALVEKHQREFAAAEREQRRLDVERLLAPVVNITTAFGSLITLKTYLDKLPEINQKISVFEQKMRDLDKNVPVFLHASELGMNGHALRELFWMINGVRSYLGQEALVALEPPFITRNINAAAREPNQAFNSSLPEGAAYIQQNDMNISHARFRTY